MVEMSMILARLKREPLANLPLGPDLASSVAPAGPRVARPAAAAAGHAKTVPDSGPRGQLFDRGAAAAGRGRLRPVQLQRRAETIAFRCVARRRKGVIPNYHILQ